MTEECIFFSKWLKKFPFKSLLHFSLFSLSKHTILYIFFQIMLKYRIFFFISVGLFKGKLTGILYIVFFHIVQPCCLALNSKYVSTMLKILALGNSFHISGIFHTKFGIKDEDLVVFTKLNISLYLH